MGENVDIKKNIDFLYSFFKKQGWRNLTGPVSGGLGSPTFDRGPLLIARPPILKNVTPCLKKPLNTAKSV